MGSDNIAVGISALSAVFAFASLWISVLSYRRGRPRVVIRGAGVVTAVSPAGTSDRAAQREELQVHCLLVNRGQARVQLADQPVVLEFQRASRRRRALRRRRPVGPPLFVSIATQLPRADIGGFVGLEVSGALPEDFITRADGDAWLCRLRLRVKLSTGDVVVGRWFPPPTGAERLIERRRADLREDAGPAMRDLMDTLGARCQRDDLGQQAAWTIAGRLRPAYAETANVVRHRSYR